MKKHTLILWVFMLCLPAALYYGLRSTPEKKPIRLESPAPHTDSAATEPARAETSPTAHTTAQPLAASNAIQSWHTAQGTKVYFLENHNLPMVDISLSFRAGSSRDAAHPGIATLWLNLLDQGTQRLDADHIAEQLENTGALLNTSLDRDRATLSLRSLTDPKVLSTVINLLAEMLSSPAFEQTSIDSIRAQQLVQIQRQAQQPNLVAYNAFYAALYGDHPYAHSGLGTEQSLETIGIADLQAFHAQYAVAKNAVMTLVGDLQIEQAKDLAEKLVQTLPAGTQAPTLPAVRPLSASLEKRIDYTAEQTHILMGAPCIAANDPDYFALLLGNYMLGANALVNELFTEIREKRGLAYNVGSNFSSLQVPGPFLIKLQTKGTQAQEAITVVKETLAHFVKEGPSEETLGAAKNGLIRAFPMSINSNAKLSDTLSNIAFYDLPLDFLDTYQKKIQVLTREQVRTALQKHLDPAKMALIVVGPAQVAAAGAP